jgi:polyhydroxybutyrate depolymerase
MIVRKYMVIYLLLIIFLVSCRHKELKAVNESETSNLKYSFTCNGENRIYYLHRPSSFNKNKSYPLVIALHGLGGNGERTAVFTGFNKISDKEGFIVVYPDGHIIKHTGKEIRCWRLDVDTDVKFISSLIDKISKDYKIDSKRIYATGISNGGMMCYVLSAKLSDKLSATASLVSSLSKRQLEKLPESKAIPLIIMNGTDDPVVPYNGGYIKIMGLKLGQVVSTEELVKYFVKRNNCSTTPVIVYEEDKDPNDGTKVRKELYSSSNNTEVILYAIEGGGHSWPGTFKGKEKSGKTSQDINASEVIWEFFKKHNK